MIGFCNVVPVLNENFIAYLFLFCYSLLNVVSSVIHAYINVELHTSKDVNFFIIKTLKNYFIKSKIALQIILLLV